MAQRDQRVHERAVALLPHVEEALVDSAAILLRGRKNVAAIAQLLGEPFSPQDDPFRSDQPQLPADTLLGDEVPSVGSRAPRHGRKAAKP